MEKEFIAKCMQMLLAKRAELVEKVSRKPEIQIEQGVAEELEATTYASGIDLAVANLNMNNETLRAVEAALNKIKCGFFGFCEDCEEEMPPKRLQNPWVALCIKCAEKREVEEGTDGRSRYSISLMATDRAQGDCAMPRKTVEVACIRPEPKDIFHRLAQQQGWRGTMYPSQAYLLERERQKTTPGVARRRCS